MNRSQRARFTKKYDVRVVPKGWENTEVEDVYASKSKERPLSIMGDKARKSKCTYYRPSNTDFGQLAKDSYSRPHDNLFIKMNRSQKARFTKKYDVRVVPKGLESTEVEDVFASKSKERPLSIMGDKSRKSKCTYYRPSNTDFGQLTEDSCRPHDNEQFGFEPFVPQRVNQLEEFEAMFRNYNNLPVNGGPLHDHVVQEPAVRIEGCSDTREEQLWQNVNTTDDLDKYMNKFRDAEVQNDFLVSKDIASKSFPPATKIDHVPKVSSFPKNIRISKVPSVKVIAEKFSKYKTHDVELRKLEDKVVCLEYDIFDRDSDSPKPFQKMRAFFSIKPVKKGNVNGEVTMVPSDVKRLFVMMDDVTLKQLDRKEIEIIDGKIPENRSLLEDLKKVLRRKRCVQNKKKRTSLDLMSMYETAKQQSPTLDADYSHTNLLSKAELEEIKDLIVTKCGSSVHGISRRKIRKDVNMESGDNDALMLSETMIAELMREPETEV